MLQESCKSIGQFNLENVGLIRALNQSNIWQLNYGYVRAEDRQSEFALDEKATHS